MENKSIPTVIYIMGYLLSFIVFLIGFWHTHLGLQEIRAFGGEYGSILIAAGILLFMLISYFMALRGSEPAFKFYVICALIFFVCNLNYFYPSYLSRDLVREEAIDLSSTLQGYASKKPFLEQSSGISEVTNLYTYRDKIIDEIVSAGGFGPDARKYLAKFNGITGGDLEPENNNIGNTQIERNKIASRYKILLDKEIKLFVVKSMDKNESIVDGVELYNAMEKLDSVASYYIPILDAIKSDNSEILIEEVSSHPQIIELQNVVSAIDNQTIKMNNALGEDVFPELEQARSKNIGKIANTISSVFSRIFKLDTWVMLILCLVIDILFPLGLYTLLKTDSNTSITKKINKRKKIT